MAFRDGLDRDVGLRLSGRARTWIGEGRLTITRDGYEQLAREAAVPRAAAEYFDRMVHAISDRIEYPGDWSRHVSIAELAAAVFLPSKSAVGVLDQLRGAGLLELPRGPQDASLMLKLTITGWQRADELRRRRRAGNKAFVAMWFHDDMEPARLAIATALQGCGYVPPFLVNAPEHDERADDPDYDRKIDDRILALIRQARIVVADATGSRPSVYYEAGFADGLGTPVIWCCKKDWVEKMAFDTRQIEHIVWNEPKDLGDQLTAKIARRGWVIEASA